MTKITRRQLLGTLGISAVIMAGSSSCCFIREIFNRPCSPVRKWKPEGKKWWRERKNEREAERKIAIATGERADLEIPEAHLVCWREDGPQGSVMSQFNNFELNVPNHFYVRIKNEGNAPAWNCIVEAYESPFSSYHMRYDELTLNDRVVTYLMPGQTIDVKLQFTVTRPTNGGIVVRAYDPVADVGLFQYEQYDRHNNGFGWTEWTN